MVTFDINLSAAWLGSEIRNQVGRKTCGQFIYLSEKRCCEGDNYEQQQRFSTNLEQVGGDLIILRRCKYIVRIVRKKK
jgi:hypothetical protein